MSAYRRLFISMMGLLAMQLAATHPLLSFSPLFVSEEEQGFVRNIDYVDRLHSSEEMPTKSGDSICDNYMIHMTPKIMQITYETFAKALVRDSREVTKQKLREVKATISEKETSVDYFFLMMKTFRKVNVTWEGELIYLALWEMVEEAENSENGVRKTTWLDQLFERIRCTVLTTDLQRVKSNLVDEISIEKEISEHFDLFKQFWLAYAKTKRTRRETTNAPIAEKKRVNEDFSCIIGIIESPLVTANITYSIFGEVLTRDSKIVVEKKLEQSQTMNTSDVNDLSKMLRNIECVQILNATQQGQIMYKKLEIINRERDEDSLWQNNLMYRIFCYAQNMHSDDFSNFIETISMTDTIKEHFDVFKQFWLNYPTVYSNDSKLYWPFDVIWSFVKNSKNMC
ncbi:uncharacterized protein LOC105212065 [Zeugodacus cucurbitae]|uniref:uncharacterized protein LOC105212065 n=1 Tax=Zeugodacus cucurbitae TaxID=28588 RepID=UPI0023D909BD|nr:uncharacterized protein LOC105212065 [Zeugodacus cucurbitae]